MQGLDTNILVRYLTQDDPSQSNLATRLMEESLTPDRPGYINVRLAVADFRDGKADFSDNLISRVNATRGCQKTFTFDKKAAKEPGFSLLK